MHRYFRTVKVKVIEAISVRHRTQHKRNGYTIRLQSTRHKQLASRERQQTQPVFKYCLIRPKKPKAEAKKRQANIKMTRKKDDPPNQAIDSDKRKINQNAKSSQGEFSCQAH
jgi:hypothetical protein